MNKSFDFNTYFLFISKITMYKEELIWEFLRIYRNNTIIEAQDFAFYFEILKSVKYVSTFMIADHKTFRMRKVLISFIAD